MRKIDIVIVYNVQQSKYMLRWRSQRMTRNSRKEIRGGGEEGKGGEGGGGKGGGGRLTFDSRRGNSSDVRSLWGSRTKRVPMLCVLACFLSFFCIGRRTLLEKPQRRAEESEMHPLFQPGNDLFTLSASKWREAFRNITGSLCLFAPSALSLSLFSTIKHFHTYQHFFRFK